MEHASTTKSDSNWANLHWEVVELFDCMCSCCGLEYEDVECKKLFQIHHVLKDGAVQRRSASKDIEEERREIALHVNEYKLILDLVLDEKELNEKLKEYNCLCDPCHYWLHIEKNVKSEIIRLGMEEQVKKKLWGNLLPRNQALIPIHNHDAPFVNFDSDDNEEIINDDDCR